jgi:hydroxymethylpyrimidine/phosphomethylpyrimidine kinase
MQRIESSCLLIGGFDPTGGAGVLADYETCLTMGVSPLCIVSANTIQDNQNFYAVSWTIQEWMKEQLHLILKTNKVDFVKFGLIENPAVLFAIVEILKRANPDVKIIWDTVGSSSSGYSFYKWRHRDVETFLQLFYLITPNKAEFDVFCDKLSYSSAIELITSKTNLLIKSFEKTESDVFDLLIEEGQELRIGYPIKTNHQNIRGTGCRLASGIMALLSKGYKLSDACKKSGQALQSYGHSLLNESLISAST